MNPDTKTRLIDIANNLLAVIGFVLFCGVVWWMIIWVIREVLR